MWVQVPPPAPQILKYFFHLGQIWRTIWAKMLALYRRHRQNCKASHSHNSRSSEYDERKKGWKRCECPIFASGTLDKVAKRQEYRSVGDEDVARLIASKWGDLREGGTALSRKSQRPDVIPDTPKRTTISEATQAYLSRCENRGPRQADPQQVQDVRQTASRILRSAWLPDARPAEGCRHGSLLRVVEGRQTSASEKASIV